MILNSKVVCICNTRGWERTCTSFPLLIFRSAAVGFVTNTTEASPLHHSHLSTFLLWPRTKARASNPDVTTDVTSAPRGSVLYTLQPLLLLLPFWQPSLSLVSSAFRWPTWTVKEKVHREENLRQKLEFFYFVYRSSIASAWRHVCHMITPLPYVRRRRLRSAVDLSRPQAKNKN